MSFLSTSSDEDLFARVQAGDTGAFDVLVKRHGGGILAFIANRLPSKQCAEDVAQEVWLRIFRNSAAFNGKNFRAWMYKIARNLVVDTYRKNTITQLPENFDFAQEEFDTEDPRSGPLNECLKAYPECEELMRMKADGLSDAEIGKKLGISVGTVGSRCSRCRIQLQECVARRQNS